MSRLNLSIPFGLRLRLLFSYFMVMATALSLTSSLAHSYKSHAFRSQMAFIRRQAVAQQISPQSIEDIDAISNPILQSFRDINTRGSLLALGAGFISISSLSCVMAYYITSPMRQIEKAVQDFAAGDLSARIPASSIPEMHRLGVSINNMAASLQDSEERRRQMMGDLAHEMATPLTVIGCYIEMLQEEQVQPTPEVLEQMHEETQRLNRLRMDALELSKVQSGHLPLNLEQFVPRQIIQGVVTTLHAVSAIKKRCTLRLECQSALPEIIADRDRFKQILINLVRNSINYTPEGSVTVHVWSESNRLWVAVVDTGIGIAEEDLPHIFERFWQAERQVTSGGSGIGLALSKGLIERQGGQIEVESKLGQGTTFRFWLPAFEPTSSNSYIEPACLIGSSRNAA